MPKEGVEPSRPESRGILSPLRLPVPPLRPFHSHYNTGPIRKLKGHAFPDEDSAPEGCEDTLADFPPPLLPEKVLT